MGGPAFIEGFAENAISIIKFEETLASKKSIEMYNDAVWCHLIGKYVHSDAHRDVHRDAQSTDKLVFFGFLSLISVGIRTKFMDERIET